MSAHTVQACEKIEVYYMIYTHLINLEGDEFHFATAKNTEDARKLITSGFEYVCHHEDLMLFRKGNKP